VRWVQTTVRWAFGLCIIAYALAIGILHVVWRTSALEIWWVQLLNVFGLWLYLPLPLLVVFALFARPRLAALLLAVPLVCFGWEYGPQFLPRPRPAVAEGRPLRVMSWNVLFSNNDVTSVGKTILEQQADVVGLQELGYWQAARLERMMAGRYPYRVLHPGGAGGLGVWSRYPIVQVDETKPWGVGCSCQRMVLDVQGQRIQLINAHPQAPQYKLRYWKPLRWAPFFLVPHSFDAAEQDIPIRTIVGDVQERSAPMIVVGDFNTSDRQPNYWLLRRYLKDAFREAGTGFGLTYPNDGQAESGSGYRRCYGSTTSFIAQASRRATPIPLPLLHPITALSSPIWSCRDRCERRRGSTP
jgi:vancomycin resistance protein VanJ